MSIRHTDKCGHIINISKGSPEIHPLTISREGVITVNRREFIKISGAGMMTLFLSGCGLFALSGNEKSGAAVPEKGSVSYCDGV